MVAQSANMLKAVELYSEWVSCMVCKLYLHKAVSWSPTSTLPSPAVSIIISLLCVLLEMRHKQTHIYSIVFT